MKGSTGENSPPWAPLLDFILKQGGVQTKGKFDDSGSIAGTDVVDSSVDSSFRRYETGEDDDYTASTSSTLGNTATWTTGGSRSWITKDAAPSVESNKLIASAPSDGSESVSFQGGLVAYIRQATKAGRQPSGIPEEENEEEEEEDEEEEDDDDGNEDGDEDVGEKESNKGAWFGQGGAGSWFGASRSLSQGMEESRDETNGGETTGDETNDDLSRDSALESTSREQLSFFGFPFFLRSDESSAVPPGGARDGNYATEPSGSLSYMESHDAELNRYTPEPSLSLAGSRGISQESRGSWRNSFATGASEDFIEEELPSVEIDSNMFTVHEPSHVGSLSRDVSIQDRSKAGSLTAEVSMKSARSKDLSKSVSFQITTLEEDTEGNQVKDKEISIESSSIPKSKRKKWLPFISSCRKKPDERSRGERSLPGKGKQSRFGNSEDGSETEETQRNVYEPPPDLLPKVYDSVSVPTKETLNHQDPVGVANDATAARETAVLDLDDNGSAPNPLNESSSNESNNDDMGATTADSTTLGEVVGELNLMVATDLTMDTYEGATGTSIAPRSVCAEATDNVEAAAAAANTIRGAEQRDPTPTMDEPVVPHDNGKSDPDVERELDREADLEDVDKPARKQKATKKKASRSLKTKQKKTPAAGTSFFSYPSFDTYGGYSLGSMYPR